MSEYEKEKKTKLGVSVSTELEHLRTTLEETKAENERLRMIKLPSPTIVEVMDENDTLRTENEKLKKADIANSDTITEQYAEILKLKEAVKDMAEEMEELRKYNYELVPENGTCKWIKNVLDRNSDIIKKAGGE